MQEVFDAIDKGLKQVSADCRRLFHGRGQCYEDLGYINVDWFEPVVLITLYREPPPHSWNELITHLDGLKNSSADVSCLLVQRRYERGAPMECVWGTVPEQPVAREQGMQYRLALDAGGGNNQNIGFFLDMSPGRRWLQRRCNNKKVLNLFAYTCAFSVAAIESGASHVVNIDMSKSALNTGVLNHRVNQHDEALDKQLTFLPYNIFRSWKKLASLGRYDIVIIDPPSRQKGSFDARRDYKTVLRRLPKLLADGGEILACLNAPDLGEDFLLETMRDNCPQAEFIERLPNRDDFPEADNQRNLKMLHFRFRGGE